MGKRKQPVEQPKEGDPDYQAKRARNNEAVKKSRIKAREKAKETTDKVEKLKDENTKLEEKVKLLTKELDFLKNIFKTHTSTNHVAEIEDDRLQRLLDDM